VNANKPKYERVNNNPGGNTNKYQEKTEKPKYVAKPQ
jgi:hypothetical protein